MVGMGEKARKATTGPRRSLARSLRQRREMGGAAALFQHTIIPSHTILSSNMVIAPAYSPPLPSHPIPSHANLYSVVHTHLRGHGDGHGKLPRRDPPVHGGRGGGLGCDDVVEKSSRKDKLVNLEKSRAYMIKIITRIQMMISSVYDRSQWLKQLIAYSET